MFDPHQRTTFWPIEKSRSDDPYQVAISDGPRAGEENQATSMVGPLVREPSALEMEIQRKSGSKSWDSSQNSSDISDSPHFDQKSTKNPLASWTSDVLGFHFSIFKPAEGSARRTTSGTVRMPRVRDGRDEKVGAGHQLIQMEAPLPLPNQIARFAILSSSQTVCRSVDQ